MRLEATGQWGPSTAHELAREWGLDRKTVYDMHGEALRYIRLSSAGTIDEERNTWLARLHAIYHAAMNNERVEHIYNPAKQEVERFIWLDRDLKSAVSAASQACKVLGLGMFKKDELDDRETAQLRDTLGKQNLEQLEMDTERMLAEIRKARATAVVN